MRPRYMLVKTDPTTYCAFLLGQSQDVDACWKRGLGQNCARESFAGSGREGGAGGCLFDRPPYCTGRVDGRLFAPPQTAGGTRLLRNWASEMP